MKNILHLERYLCILCVNVAYIKTYTMNFALSLELQYLFLLIISWIFLIKIVLEKLYPAIEIKVKEAVAWLKCYLG